MSEFRREKPLFQLSDDLLFLRRLLDLGKAIEVRVCRELGRHGALGAKEKECEFLKTRLSLSGEDAGPPIGAGEILA